MLKLKLHWQILIAFILAIFYGLLFPHQVKYVAWMGDLFLRGLRMIIVPLILTSIISGVTSMGSSGNKSKSRKTC